MQLKVVWDAGMNKWKLNEITLTRFKFSEVHHYKASKISNDAHQATVGMHQNNLAYPFVYQV